jgi:hypothetical protein
MDELRTNRNHLSDRPETTKASTLSDVQTP